MLTKSIHISHGDRREELRYACYTDPWSSGKAFSGKTPYFLAVFFEFLSNLVHSYIMDCPRPPFPFSCIAYDDRDQGVDFDVEHWTNRTLLMVWIRDPWRHVVQFLYLKSQGSLGFYGLEPH